MAIVAVLSHLMDQHGLLNLESLARIDKAVELFEERKCHRLITSGWAYREDSPLAIGAVVSEYIRQHYQIDDDLVISDIRARDTVGDAFYIRDRLKESTYSTLLVVTSDYHVARAKIIFDAFFRSIASVDVIGAFTESHDDNSVLKHERESIHAFGKTFDGVDLQDDSDVAKTLRQKHPFYNGVVHPKISFEFDD